MESRAVAALRRRLTTGATAAAALAVAVLAAAGADGTLMLWIGGAAAVGVGAWTGRTSVVAAGLALVCVQGLAGLASGTAGLTAAGAGLAILVAGESAFLAAELRPLGTWEPAALEPRWRAEASLLAVAGAVGALAAVTGEAARGGPAFLGVTGALAAAAVAWLLLRRSEAPMD